MRRFTQILPVLLAVTLQIMPLVRNLFANPAFASNMAFILRWGIGTGAALGAVDAVSGATSTFTSPSSFNGSVGTVFSNNVIVSIGGGNKAAPDDYFILQSGTTTSPLLYNGQSTVLTLPPGLAFTASWVDGAGTIGGYIKGTPTTAGSYPTTITVVSPGNATLSQNVSIVIQASSGPVAPAISSQPLGRTNATGTSVQFSVTATGTAPFAYQWLKNKSPLTNAANVSGSQSNVLSIAALSTNDNGNFSVVITNAAGVVTSSVAPLLVLLPPAIILQPFDTTNSIAQNAVFTVSNAGSAPLSYRWYKAGTLLTNGAKYSGATTATLSVGNLTANDSGSYSVVITNFVGSITSRLAALTVLAPPSITAHPTNQNAATGGSVSFAVNVNGTAPMHYLWYKDGSPLADGGGISGSTSNVLNLQGITTNSAGTYFVTVSNALGGAVSSNAALAVLAVPVILSQSSDTYAVTGSVATLNVQADGAAPLVYRWFKNNTAITDGTKFSGVNTASLGISSLLTNDSGTYSCVITNVAGSVTSSPIALSVQLPVFFTLQASNRAVKLGTNTSFRAAVVGSTPFVYQWFKNGNPLADGGNISGSQSNVLTVSSLTTNDNGAYSLTVSNAVAAITSSNAVLTVLEPPVIRTQPASQNIVISNAVTFNVEVDGTAPFTYQWRLATTKNGKTTYKAIKGATNAFYGLTNVLTKNAAGYQVIIKNRAGAATSSVANLTVLLPVSFTLQASNRAVKIGNSTYFRAAVKGTAPYVFQWYKDGTPLADGGAVSGSTSNVLAITSLTTNDNGAYSIVVSNAVNVITSSNALLTVLLPPVITVPATNQSVVISNTATFTVVVEGSAPFKYQWYKGKTAIKGATNATYAIASVKTTDAATNYTVVISNRAGSATNPPVSLAVLASALVVKSAVAAGSIAVAPPGEIGIIANPDGTFSIGFTGTPNAVYTLQAAESFNAGWQSIGSAAAQPDGSWEMTDSNAAAFPARFYRVLVGPPN